MLTLNNLKENISKSSNFSLLTAVEHSDLKNILNESSYLYHFNSETESWFETQKKYIFSNDLIFVGVKEEESEKIKKESIQLETEINCRLQDNDSSFERAYSGTISEKFISALLGLYTDDIPSVGITLNIINNFLDCIYFGLRMGVKASKLGNSPLYKKGKNQPNGGQFIVLRINLGNLNMSYCKSTLKDYTEVLVLIGVIEEKNMDLFNIEKEFEGNLVKYALSNYENITSISSFLETGLKNSLTKYNIYNILNDKMLLKELKKPLIKHMKRCLTYVSKNFSEELVTKVSDNFLLKYLNTLEETESCSKEVESSLNCEVALLVPDISQNDNKRSKYYKETNDCLYFYIPIGEKITTEEQGFNFYDIFNNKGTISERNAVIESYITFLNNKIVIGLGVSGLLKRIESLYTGNNLKDCKIFVLDIHEISASINYSKTMRNMKFYGVNYTDVVNHCLDLGLINKNMSETTKNSTVLKFKESKEYDSFYENFTYLLKVFNVFYPSKYNFFFMLMKHLNSVIFRAKPIKDSFLFTICTLFGLEKLLSLSSINLVTPKLLKEEGIVDYKNELHLLYNKNIGGLCMTESEVFSEEIKNNLSLGVIEDDSDLSSFKFDLKTTLPDSVPSISYLEATKMAYIFKSKELYSFFVSFSRNNLCLAEAKEYLKLLSVELINTELSNLLDTLKSNNMGIEILLSLISTYIRSNIPINTEIESSIENSIENSIESSIENSIESSIEKQKEIKLEYSPTQRDVNMLGYEKKYRTYNYKDIPCYKAYMACTADLSDEDLLNYWSDDGVITGRDRHTATNYDKSVAIRMYEKGFSCTEISKRTKISISSISRLLDKLNILDKIGVV